MSSTESTREVGAEASLSWLLELIWLRNLHFCLIFAHIQFRNFRTVQSIAVVNLVIIELHAYR